VRTVFAKLGGSLLTDKRVAEKPRSDVIRRVAQEIAEALRTAPELRLVVGHGSGSFGHVYGSRYGTRNGVTGPEQWYGFASTGDAAARLNRLVVQALLDAGVPAWSIQPGALLLCRDGIVVDGSAAMVLRAQERGLTPVVYGDVALDEALGGTIVSTEEIFEWLAPQLRPERLVLAGEVDGVYTADPQEDAGATLIQELTPESFAAVEDGLGGSFGVDVTGGMAAKVTQAMQMVRSNPGLTVVVCSGLKCGNVLAALTEQAAVRGTRICG
jgi:isopentenyl phosphate kinase